MLTSGELLIAPTEGKNRMLSGGVYGLTFSELGSAPGLVSPAGDDWVDVRLDRRRGHGPFPPTTISEQRAAVRVDDGGQVIVSRRQRRATVLSSRVIPVEELVHPYLSPVGAVFAHWLGWQALHAGAVAGPGGAWGVLGPSGAGKSTMLAWLALRGWPVVSDDLLVTRDMEALAGPRMLDIRPSAAGQVGGHRRFNSCRGGSRRRLRLSAIDPQIPLAGWIFLAWGDGPSLVGLGPSERLRRLGENRMVRLVSSTTPARLLDLATLPAWELRRPKRWDLLGVCAERVLELVSA
ncbi:hypothetical protein BH20ACT23_BH20ACT23_14500 [soil metagenome]